MIKFFFFEFKFILRDIYHFFSNDYKIPISNLFNFLPYQRLRMFIDDFFTKKFQFKFKNEKWYFDAINSGIIVHENAYEKKELNYIKNLSENLIKDYKNHSIVYYDANKFKDKINKYSVYADYYRLPLYDKGNNTQMVSNFYHFFFSYKYLLTQLNFFSGYKCSVENISIDICKVKGELNTDDWHSDCFSHTAKAFFYLNDVEADNSPFCFLIGSHKNAKLKKDIEIENSRKTSINFHNANKKISADDIWNRLKDSKSSNKIFSIYENKECIYNSNTMIIADTSGFHRKGYSSGKKERFMVCISANRGNLLKKISF